MQINKNLLYFFIFHLVIWSIIPIMMRPNLPMDSAEALIWGMIGEFGTNKHPPLSGYLANWMWLICGKNPASLYVLSQILVIGGLYYIYKLARCFFSQNKSLIITMLCEGIVYYNYTTTEYNCNIVALLLWPACAYYFYQSVKTNSLVDWTLFGFFAGLNIINKYVSAILLLCLGLYVLCSAQARIRLKSYKIYYSAILAFAIITPHFLWAYNHDFFMIDYFIGRSTTSAFKYGLGHIVYPLKFIFAQILAALPALIVLFVYYKKSNKIKSTISSDDKKFIFFAGILPLLIMTTIPLITGMKLKSMWGSPCLYALTIIWFVWFNFDETKYFAKIKQISYYLMSLFALVFFIQTLLTLSPKYNLDAQKLVRELNGNNIDYVGGNIWLASIIGSYSNSNPQVMFDMSAKTNPWIDIDDIKQKGALVVEESLAAYENHKEEFTNLEPAKEYIITSSNILGKTKKHTIYYGNLKGENNER